jgi:hypothetical protein
LTPANNETLTVRAIEHAVGCLRHILPTNVIAGLDVLIEFN